MKIILSAQVYEISEIRIITVNKVDVQVCSLILTTPVIDKFGDDTDRSNFYHVEVYGNMKVAHLKNIVDLSNPLKYYKFSLWISSKNITNKENKTTWINNINLLDVKL